MKSSRTREAAFPAFVFLLGLVTILGAWGFQLIGGFVPCKLCLEQRIPYYVGLPLALLALIAALAGARPWLSRGLLALSGIAFLIGLGLAVYHAGAEWTWWPGPADCGGGTSTATSAGDLLSRLDNTRVVSCTEASWRLLGLSFAGWNAVVSLILVVAALIGVTRRRSA
jgi:disulfide bond formation protein DsbB